MQRDMGPRSREQRETLVSIAVTLVAAATVIIMRAPDRWFAAIFITVSTFSGIICYFKRRWNSAVFWAVIAIGFLTQCLLMWLIFGIALRQVEDVGLLPCIPFIFIEAFVLYHTVRRLDNQLSRSSQSVKE